jgi:hypothetical protein
MTEISLSLSSFTAKPTEAKEQKKELMPDNVRRKMMIELIARGGGLAYMKGQKEWCSVEPSVR